MSAYYKSIEVELEDQEIDIVIDLFEEQDPPPALPTSEFPVLSIFSNPTKEYPSSEVVRLLQAASVK